MSNDKDKLAEYYESAEANQDSRSDAWVAFIIIVVFVVEIKVLPTNQRKFYKVVLKDIKK